MTRFDRLTVGNTLRGFLGFASRAGAVMFTGAGSGLWEQTRLGDGQRARSLVLQDTRRSFDQITWRRNLAFARQLYTANGELRGPVNEKATLANSGGWIPRFVGKRTARTVRNRYEEWAWNWMKVCDIRGQPYDFFTDMYLASISMDRDGEAAVIFTQNRDGNPRLQWVANHRIYSHQNIFVVTERTLPNGRENPYYGMKMNNGVVYDDAAAPVAYYVLEQSLQFTQSYQGTYVPVRSMHVNYMPDWMDQGRGVTTFSHGIKRMFDLDDIHGYLLLGIKRDAALQIVRESAAGKVNKAAEYIGAGTSPVGTAISLEEMQGGGLWDVQVGKGGYQIAPVQNPRSEAQEYIESIYTGIYQGLEWPYEFSRLSKESKGANIRVTCERINQTVHKQYQRLRNSAVRAVGYAVGTAVARGELPQGEWWACDFPKPSEITPDIWRAHQEDRENLKMGTTTLANITSRRSLHWQDDIREQRDEEQDDKMQRCEKLYLAHKQRCEASDIEPMAFEFFVQDYEQRSANPVMNNPGDNSGEDDDESKPTNKSQKGKD